MVEPLWRGLIVYRLLTLALAAVLIIVSIDRYRSPAAVIAVLGVMAAWTVVVAVGYSRRADPGRADRRRTLAVLDLLVTVAVMATTPLVAPAEALADAVPVMGSMWTSGAVLAVAVARGLTGGLLGAVVISGMLLAVHPHWGADQRNDIQVLVLAGLTVGYAATAMRRSERELRDAVAVQGAAAERERLSRSIHDGVLQVLAHVRRRGTELGGAAAELGRQAGEQEIALRGLLVHGPSTTDSGGQRDLAAALAGLGSVRVTVSVPGTPVELPGNTVDELLGVVREALSNVERHVGPEAPAWVLVEDLGDRVEVSVRDDGPGIPAGRLVTAHAQGRLGVAESMRGRVAQLGGTITCETGPALGTEWVVRIPRPRGARR